MLNRSTGNLKVQPNASKRSGIESKPFVLKMTPDEMEDAYRFVDSLNLDVKDPMAGGDVAQKMM